LFETSGSKIELRVEYLDQGKTFLRVRIVRARDHGQPCHLVFGLRRHEVEYLLGYLKGETPYDVKIECPDSRLDVMYTAEGYNLYFKGACAITLTEEEGEQLLPLLKEALQVAVDIEAIQKETDYLADHRR
jgi:hypothetical protein